MRHILGILALLSLAATLHAATFTVSTAADSGPGSFRTAIAQANATPGHDDIVFASAMTIALASPLPAILESVSINTTQLIVSLDGAGAGASADGLTIDGDNVGVAYLRLRRFGGNAFVVRGGHASLSFCRAGRDVSLPSNTQPGDGGDGLLLAGDDAYVEFFEAAANRTAIRITGSRNEVYGFAADWSRQAGIVIAAGASGNRVGRYVDPGVTFAIIHPDGGEVGDSGDAGIIIDGHDDSVVNVRVRRSAGDGLLVRGSGNKIAFDEASSNGGNGVTLLATVLWESNFGACNSRLFVDVRGDGPTANDDPDIDSVVNAPSLQRAWQDGPSTTIDGLLIAAPNTSYRIDFLGITGACPGATAMYYTPLFVTTNANGHADIHHAVAGSATRFAATAARLLPDGTPGGGSSELSAEIASGPRICDPVICPADGADLRVDLLSPPASVATGSTVTINYRITNSGPSGQAVTLANFTTVGGSGPGTDPNQDPAASCGNSCLAGSLAAGESVIVHRILTVTGAPGTQLHETATVSPGGPPPDSNASNNSAILNVPIVAAAAVPALSMWGLALLGLMVGLLGWRMR